MMGRPGFVFVQCSPGAGKTYFFAAFRNAMRSGGSVARITYLERPSYRAPTLVVENAPKVQPGKFVGVINELAEMWTAGRYLAPQQPVHRHLKVVRDRDHG